MRRFAPPVFVLALLFGVSHRVQAQDNPTTGEQGLKPYGAFHGGDIDSISLANTKLNLHIPLVSYPQRGGRLHVGFSVISTAPVYTPTVECVGKGQCIAFYQRSLSSNSHTFVSIVPDFQPVAGCGPINNCPYQQVWEPDGSTHRMGFVAGGLWRSTDATGYVYNPTTQVLTDRSGVQYTMGSSYKVEDPNGNKITSSGGVWTDTIGRAIPTPVYSGTNTGNPSLCPTGGSLLPIANAYSWVVPAQNGGTSTFTICTAQVADNSTPPECTNNPNCTAGGFSSNDIQSIVLPNGTAWNFLYDNGAIAEVIFPTGGSISYAPTLYTFCLGANHFYYTYTYGVASRTVNANDGTGPHTWNYGQIVQMSMVQTTVTDPLSNVTVHTLTRMGPVVASCALYEIQSDHYQGSVSTANLRETVITDYPTPTADPYPDGNGVINVVPIHVKTEWPNGKTSQVQTDYDTGVSLGGSSTNVLYGVVLAKREYDYPSGSALLRTTTNTYKYQSFPAYLTANLLDLLLTVRVTDSGGTQRALATYDYDNGTPASSGITTQHDPTPPDGSTRGNQTSVSRWENGSTVSTTNCSASVTNGNVTTNNTFYDTGMISRTTDPCGHATTFTYSATFAGAYVTQTQFPDTSSPILTHHIISGNYDFNTGLLTGRTDENSRTTTYAYDNLLRLTNVTYPSPDGGQWNYFYPDMVTVERTKQIDGTRTTDEFAHFDGLGREIRHIAANDEGTPYDQVDTCYDAGGRVSFKSYAYQGSGLGASQVCSGAGDSFAYDALNRVMTVTHGDGSTVLTSYTGAATSVSDEGNGTRRVQRVSQVDGIGRMASLCEVSSITLTVGLSPTPAACGQDIGATGFLTTYGYDVLGNLTSVAQGGLTARTFQYDSLSRLTSASNPESGTITYAYDEDGLAITKTAPKPNQTSSLTVVTTMAYDPLHRLRSKSYNDGSTPTATLNYDETSALGVASLANTTGRESSSTVAGSLAGEVFSYDELGRPKVHSQCTPQNCSAGTVFPVSYTYNYLAMTSGTNGAGVTLNYTVNRALRLTQLTSSLSDMNHPGTLYLARALQRSGVAADGDDGEHRGNAWIRCAAAAQFDYGWVGLHVDDSGHDGLRTEQRHSGGERQRERQLGLRVRRFQSVGERDAERAAGVHGRVRPVREPLAAAVQRGVHGGIDVLRDV